MSNLDQVKSEFERQANTFDAWAVKTDDRVGQRFLEALGDAKAGRLLDVACGPGVVTEAVAMEASSVVAFDATTAMLDKAQARCSRAGLTNVTFESGDAHALPFANASFDGVISRLAVHHFADPEQVFSEMARVLRPGGILVIADVVASEASEEADLQNAIERLRDPSHTRMLSVSELSQLFSRAGLMDLVSDSWDKAREFEEWMGIVDVPGRTESLRIVVRALAEVGRTAGMGLRVKDDRIEFFHRWCLTRGWKRT